MKASLRSVRIAPKKANLVAKMIRGLSVNDALHSLQHTNKKAARILEELLKSAMSNARHNDNQSASDLSVKTIVVNKAQAFHRGVPMARGRVRRMRKFLSHIDLTLGITDDAIDGTASKTATTKEAPKQKEEKKTSQAATKSAQSSSSSAKKATSTTKAAKKDTKDASGTSKSSAKKTKDTTAKSSVKVSTSKKSTSKSSSKKTS